MNLTNATKYWPLLLSAVGIVAWWATTGQRINALEAQTKVNTDKIEQATAASQAIDVRLSRIETDIQWVRSSLEKER